MFRLPEANHAPLVPAKAGTEGRHVQISTPRWIPASAGMSGGCFCLIEDSFSRD